MSLLKDIIEESFDVKESYGRTFINEKKKKSTGKWKMSDAERKAEKQKKHEANKQKNLDNLIHYKNKHAETLEKRKAGNQISSEAANIIDNDNINLSKCWQFVKKRVNLHLDDDSGSRLTKWKNNKSEMPDDVAHAVVAYKDSI